ncbi:hypothetical protein GCM10019059_42610 [Camelimonas fluminis]|uniref:MbcA/ParS/Xre antitoxin family protein n=1 Tax=Camelimonas fluminis TaxID=1576911 RepID=A0ABV7UI10_9HYPH|nr:antitoxin Xre/MbcA/ParS toxin-binding domain-containing protein [Camelimonas fluminis]GHE79598.1 hypothetical protein GCM10019059_42610 [Camelimonas fluminis]
MNTAPQATLPQEPYILGPEIVAPERRKRVSAPGLRAFATIADLWDLKEPERLRILGHQPKTAFYAWMRKGRQHHDLTLDFDVLIRISLILGIYSALRILYDSEEAGLEWLKRPNKASTFGGRAPMELITSGSQDALFQVRGFLDGARGGLFMEPNEADENFRPYTDTDIIWS